MVTDPVVTEYVNRVGQNLVRNSDAKVPFTIKVIDSDEINAFALPGGFFYVNSGLILQADERGGTGRRDVPRNCARCRAARNQERYQRGNCAVGFHSIDSARTGRMGRLRSLPGIEFGDADRLPEIFHGTLNAKPTTWAVQYMYKAGYHPNAFVSFFEKIQGGGAPVSPAAFPRFSTHPPTPERVQKAQEEIADDPARAGRVYRHHIGVRPGEGAAGEN